MGKVIEFLKGKKTYLQVAAAFVVYALSLTGVVTEDVANQILIVLGLGSIASMRAAITRKS